MPATDLTTIVDVLPYERAILGGAMDAPRQKLPPLLEDEFATDTHRCLWRVILQVRARGEASDPLMVQEALREAGDLAAVGGPAYLALLMVEAAVSVFMFDYARVVRQAATARKKAQLGAELQAQALSDAEITERLKAMPGPVGAPLFDPAARWRQIVEGWRIERLTTGYAGLDRLTGGIGRGDFWVVGGRTSHGKTAWAVDLSLRLASRGVRVDFVTLEDPAVGIVRRAVANLSRTPTRLLKDGSLTDESFREAERAVRTLQAWPLTVIDVEHLRTLSDVAVVGAVSASEAQVVIVDHLQQIATGDERRHYGLERVLHALHALALRDRKAVLVTAQLNRETEARQDAPRLSDLRDTGAAEQVGRVVCLLYWPVKHDRQRDPGEYEVYLAKQHDGATGMVRLHFEPAVGRFGDADEPGP